ncbi:hypothetical protein [Asaia astilbis]|uniref:hypothetical protein n=1 Tax=Asaia astilbis TaxID=610244 RepID=UPI001E2CD375|nr:hypothetical protein [Asaia astilbis]
MTHSPSIRRSARALGGLAGLLMLAACQGTAAPGPTPPGTQVVGYGYTCKAGIYTCKMPTRCRSVIPAPVPALVQPHTAISISLRI